MSYRDRLLAVMTDGDRATRERALRALTRLPTTTAAGHPASVRTVSVFGHGPCGLSFPLNRKTAENAVTTIPLDGLEPRQESMAVKGLESYIVRSRRDPPDVVRYRTRDGRERFIVQEGHTRLGAAVLRGEAEMPVRLWEFVESPTGTPEPVPRGRHRDWRSAAQAAGVDGGDHQPAGHSRCQRARRSSGPLSPRAQAEARHL